MQKKKIKALLCTFLIRKVLSVNFSIFFVCRYMCTVGVITIDRDYTVI